MLINEIPAGQFENETAIIETTIRQAVKLIKFYCYFLSYERKERQYAGN